MRGGTDHCETAPTWTRPTNGAKLCCTVRRLLAAGADAGLLGLGGRTVLIAAAESGDADAVEAVLSTTKSGHMDAVDWTGATALHKAYEAGSAGANQLLLMSGGWPAGLR